MHDRISEFDISNANVVIGSKYERNLPPRDLPCESTRIIFDIMLLDMVLTIVTDADAPGAH
jgi:hypothetical protein